MGLSSLAGMAHAKRLLTEAVVLPLKFPHLFRGEHPPAVAERAAVRAAGHRQDAPGAGRGRRGGRRALLHQPRGPPVELVRTDGTIDPAFLRRFEKRIFIGLPDRECRQEIIRSSVNFHVEASFLQAPEWLTLLDRTEGFSGSDITDLVKNALYQPIRELTTTMHWSPTAGGLWMPCPSNTIGALRQNMDSFPPHTVVARNVTVRDFLEVLETARPTVCHEDLERYELFTRQFGQLG
ncbi:hypothetical protein FOCC_FOCC000764 [Frankliniella occidentalis]|nr:hypothetical protein FOCC_FOCC000764 [Frankliniella occidentalis]